MLKAIELKVGNKFKSCYGNVQTVKSIIDNSDGGKIKVLSKEDYDSGKIGYASENHRLMYSHLILCEENGNQYKPCEIEGEPITEEWLDRFGWVKDGDYYNYGDWTILLKGSLPEHDGLFYNRTNVNAKFFPKMKYVHKLQNFILDNTEKEMILIK